MIRDFVALDIETTGLDPKNDRIIEIGAVKYIDGERTSDFATFVNPRMEIPERIVELTGITDAMVKDAPEIEDVIPKLVEFVGELPLLGHNIIFDFSFIKKNALMCGIKYEKNGIDTYRISKLVHADLPSRSLEQLCEHYQISEEPRHRAFSDAAAAARLYSELYDTARLHVKTHMEGENEVPDRQPYIPKEELEKLFTPSPLIYQVKKESPITEKQVAFLKSLIKKHNIDFTKEVESLTKNQASREIDKILSLYGRF